MASEIDVIEKGEKPHNGKTISDIAVSPKGIYVVTYSEDDKSIVGWNIDVDVVEDSHPLNVRKYGYVTGMKVSDNKVLLIYRQKNLHIKVYKLGKGEIK